ncbi:MAG: class I SAM-dependent methyltransferase [Microcoleaceae cyanobacterium]
MSVIDLFSEASDRYAAARPQYPRELYQFLAASVKTPGRVWDCGAGNGQASIGLAEFFTEVYATDISAQQVANAIACDNVTYSVHPAESTHFSENFFDAVVVAQALHWFDFDRFWLEVKRVLKPEGLFAAWAYSSLDVSPEVNEMIQQEISDVIAPFWSDRIRHIWTGYKEINFPFAPMETPLFEIRLDWRLSDLLAYMSTWSATRQCIQEQGDQFFQTAAQQLAEVWENPEQQKTVTMKLHLFAGKNI